MKLVWIKNTTGEFNEPENIINQYWGQGNGGNHTKECDIKMPITIEQRVNGFIIKNLRDLNLGLKSQNGV